MRDELAKPVYKLIRSGLDLKERIKNSPESEDFQKEQSNLKELLRQIPDLGEDRSDDQDAFLGLRYPLACWLDEIFILDSSWKDQWNANSLEQALYQSRDRAFKFWDQAKLAEKRVSADAVEIFYLCAMLGFRGRWNSDLDRLKSWHEASRSMLLKGQQSRWPEPPVSLPPTYVPPLTGEERKRSMFLAWAISLLVMIPIAMFMLIVHLSRN